MLLFSKRVVLFKKMNFIRRSRFINFSCMKHLSTNRGIQELLNIGHIAGINKFIKHREKSKLLIKNPSEYLSNLAQASNISSDSIIFSEDIKNVVTLAETDADILLLEKVLLKFSSQKNIVQYNPFFFGPQIMRLLYIKNKPHKALELVQNPNLAQYFRHAVSGVLLLDMLFNNNMYHSVIEMYESLRKIADRKYNDNLKLYFFAACYKSNSDNILEKAKAVWCSELQENRAPVLRIRLLFAMILLNQNECPSDVITSSPSGAFVSLKENIKYMVLAKGNRFWDVFKAAEDVLNSERVNYFAISQETLSFIEKEVQKSTEDNIVKFHKIKQELINKNLVVYEPLETFLLGDMSMGKNRFPGLKKENQDSEITETFHLQKMPGTRDMYREMET